MNVLLWRFSFVAVNVCTVVLAAFPARAASRPDLAVLAHDAVSTNEATSRLAIARLRDAGPAGLEAILAVSPARKAKLPAKPAFASPPRGAKAVDPLAPLSPGVPVDPEVARWHAAVDAIAGQRDAAGSRLYWYTDFGQAQAAAERTGRPILSLHMLGKLTDEYSCANSRFFRTVLYANQEVSGRLRERFVLHWNTVRLVPSVTIDFGDGRKLKRTITGNSIHYVIDRRGRLVDALPGLYGPEAFLRILDDAETAARKSADLGGVALAEHLSGYHESAAGKIRDAWTADLKELGALADADVVSMDDEAALERRSQDHWPRIAARHALDARLDAASIELVRRDPPAVAAGALAFSKRKVEDPLLRVVAMFQDSVALDTVRNEYLLHRKVHRWLAEAPQPELAQFNGRVYADLFLMPLDDPWLGLVAPGVYSALRADGVLIEQAAAR